MWKGSESRRVHRVADRIGVVEQRHVVFGTKQRGPAAARLGAQLLHHADAFDDERLALGLGRRAAAQQQGGCKQKEVSFHAELF